MSTEVAEFTCGQCDATFPTNQQRASHIWGKHTERQGRDRETAGLTSTGLTQIYPCTAPGCDREFATTTSRAEHTIEHHGAEPTTTWPCSRCDRTFGTRAKRDAHEDIDHRAERRQERTEMEETTARCYCGRELRHRGRHKGTQSASAGGGPMVETPEPPKIEETADGAAEPTPLRSVPKLKGLPERPREAALALRVPASGLQELLDYLGEIDTGGGSVAEVANLPALRHYQLLADAIEGNAIA